MNQENLKKIAYGYAMEIVFSSNKDELVDNIAEALVSFYNDGNKEAETLKSTILNYLKEE